MKLTKAQIKKLETVIAKLEALQQEVKDDAAWLSDAKSSLMRYLRVVSN